MTDRELLELAAKAVGINVVFYERHGLELCKKENDYGPDNRWNPLTDDGDALRMAVKLGLFMRKAVKEIPRVEYDKDPYAATRRAIVCAAAEIGKLK